VCVDYWSTSHRTLSEIFYSGWVPCMDLVTKEEI